MLDVSALIESLGDEGIVREIAAMHLESCPSLLEKIRASVARRDARSLQEGAHALKGAIGNFDSGKAHQAAQRLEIMAKEGNLSQAAEELQTFERELEALNRALRAFLNSSVQT